MRTEKGKELSTLFLRTEKHVNLPHRRFRSRLHFSSLFAVPLPCKSKNERSNNAPHGGAPARLSGTDKYLKK